MLKYMSYDHLSEAVFYTITVVVGGGFFRLWGVHMLCICGDGVLSKVTLNPIDSHKSMYYTMYNIMIPFVLAGQLQTNTPHYIHFF
jgi:hypothetical protein